MKPSFIFLFVICTFPFTHCLVAAKRTTTSTSTSTSFIKESCGTTSYPRVCFATLSRYAAQIQTDPKLLATESLSVAQDAAQSAEQIIGRLSRIRGLSPKEAAALNDCTMAVENSAAQLQRAIEEMESGMSVWGRRKQAAELVVSDVQTWTSTALTYAGTCLGGFSESNMNGNVKIIVRRKIWRLTQLTSNALALVNTYASSRNAHHHNP